MLLAHMRDCLDRIAEYANAERTRFDASRLVQDAVIRNLQTPTEPSQPLSSEIKGSHRCHGANLPGFATSSRP